MAVTSKAPEIQAAKTTFTLGSADKSRDAVFGAPKPSEGLGATDIEGQNVSAKAKPASKGQDDKSKAKARFDLGSY